jgi:hypothetical protein
LRDRAEGSSDSQLITSSSATSQKIRKRKAATAAHQLSAIQELMEIWNTKSEQENHSPEDRYQLLELRDKILRLSKYHIKYF